MDEEDHEMLARLKFLEEFKKILTQNSSSMVMKGWEYWVMGKLLTYEKVNKEMYRVLRSLWYTNDWVNFVEVGARCFLIKFDLMDDRERIFNLSP